METDHLILRPVLEDRVFIAQNLDLAIASDFHVISTKGKLEYIPLCDDFGPMSLTHIFQFVEMLDHEISKHPKAKVAYTADDKSSRSLTNAVFLLGAYLVVKYDAKASRVRKCFSWVDDNNLVPYRDSTFSKPDFDLTLLDCWRALERAMNIGWIGFPSSPGIWGQYDLQDHEHYEKVANAGMHAIVPGKIIAFKGPVDLQGAEYADGAHGSRRFAPNYYVDIFRELNVTAVVRLNSPEYDESVFEEAGIKVFDLSFEAGLSPPDRIAASFLRLVDRERGAVAVHCRRGLGRTGTLIARWLMRSHAFSAREAMAWVRIVRPGSIVGEQQHYLAAAESLSHPPALGPCSPDMAKSSSCPNSPLTPARGGVWGPSPPSSPGTGAALPRVSSGPPRCPPSAPCSPMSAVSSRSFAQSFTFGRASRSAASSPLAAAAVAAAAAAGGGETLPSAAARRARGGSLCGGSLMEPSLGRWEEEGSGSGKASKGASKGGGEVGRSMRTASSRA